MAAPCNFQIFFSFLITFLVIGSLNLNLSFAHYSPAVHDGHDHHHCDHGHHHHHHGESHSVREKKLPEELAEEEDLRLLQFGSHHVHVHEHDHDHHHGVLELSGVGLWVHAMGCSLLVSLASLICLILLPFIFIKGKPSKAFVDALAVFGAGAMLGDAFLHQLPHAFGGEHSHSHDSHVDDPHQHDNLGNNHSHAHSLKDLSVGLSVLAGIVLFLLVEKIVRYVEHMSGGVNGGHGHHHHHHHDKKNENVVNDNDDHDNVQGLSPGEKDGSISEIPSEERQSESAVLRKKSDISLGADKKVKCDIYYGTEGVVALAHDHNCTKNFTADYLLALRNVSTSAGEHKPGLDKANGRSDEPVVEKGPARSSSSLVFGYLNLFSDGVHNFTDGMALGSAFLLHGSIGGWSRTLFLLAHELPQEIGDFGILVRSGFSVSKALFFNFLSALVALAGTAMALLVGQNPGQSSLIEGFTAGGFIYIAVAGVLAEMNNGSSALRNTSIQLTALMLGMGVALFISLVE